MTWFKVDDGLHAHPKTLASSLPALGLWLVAGSWSSDHLTDGLVPDHVLPLLSRGAPELADELVAAKLWRKVKGGYRFHDWKQCNPTRAEVEYLRRTRAEAGRKGGLTSRKPRSKPQATTEASVKANVKHAGLPHVITPDPTRPIDNRSARGLTTAGPETSFMPGTGRMTGPPELPDPTEPDWDQLRRQSTGGPKDEGGHHGEGA